MRYEPEKQRLYNAVIVEIINDLQLLHFDIAKIIGEYSFYYPNVDLAKIISEKILAITKPDFTNQLIEDIFNNRNKVYLLFRLLSLSVSLLACDRFYSSKEALEILKGIGWNAEQSFFDPIVLLKKILIENPEATEIVSDDPPINLMQSNRHGDYVNEFFQITSHCYLLLDLQLVSLSPGLINSLTQRNQDNKLSQKVGSHGLDENLQFFLENKEQIVRTRVFLNRGNDYHCALFPAEVKKLQNFCNEIYEPEFLNCKNSAKRHLNLRSSHLPNSAQEIEKLISEVNGCTSFPQLLPLSDRLKQFGFTFDAGITDVTSQYQFHGKS